MGCVPSKQAVSVTPAALDHSGAFNVGSGRSRVESCDLMTELELNLKKVKKRGATESASFRLGNLHKYVEAEQVAAGWPVWLTTVAGEAIHGWVPLNADSFEKLEKIGQGTYSTVFKARQIETDKIVALKKVRFDNFEPESVRFMAREIMILRKLDHPNIIKLEGIITSRSSCNIYLVFEYMEHDVAGLLSSPDISFTEAQVKCYMKQLLSGLEHCHSRGVMHRDIKGANLLVDNNGILKIADFGLANFCSQPLTNRVVTLWYRPPELLLGSTDYGPSVDLWSIGCVLAELLTGTPILKGRTEVEQLHKIFKLCGSPPDDYWKKLKFPHASLFKPQKPYESSLWETFKDLPEAAVTLIETLLSVESYKRGTAASALTSQYFKTVPYACDPLNLPKYPPCKEIDIKHQEEASRKRHNGRSHAPVIRKPTRKPDGTNKLAPEENFPHNTQGESIMNGIGVGRHKVDKVSVQPPMPSISTRREKIHVKNASQGDDDIYSGPLELSGSSGFAWAKRRTIDFSFRSRSRSTSRSLITEPSSAMHLRNNMDSSIVEEKCEAVNGEIFNLRRNDSYETINCADPLSISDGYRSHELLMSHYRKEEPAAKINSLVYNDEGEKVQFSGPLLSQSKKIDELLEKHERHIR